MAYQIKLQVFEGPFDLLFHLIEKNEVDIYDIPIAEITEQYVEYINNMQRLDLEIASEFLVMAATLLSIKARMLLPKPPKEAAESEVEEEADPRDVLVEKLLEYKKFKVLGEYLQQKESYMTNVFTRPNEDDMFLHLFSEENPLEGVSMHNLLEALREVLDRAVEQNLNGEIVRDEVTVKDKIKEIMRRLFFNTNGIVFRDLFSTTANRVEIIVTFLAILELIKLGKIKAYQPRPFAELMIYSRAEEDAG